MATQLFEVLTLPSGQTIKNRIAKAAMEENLAIEGFAPGERLIRLYEKWSRGGAGLLITGNVMVDHRAMTGPGGVALEADSVLEPFRRWSRAAKSGGAKVWMQINHPGRQVYAAMGGEVLSASDIALDMGRYSKLFGQPKAMDEVDIHFLIERFVTTAKKAVEAGFDGVQIHAAHGYLLSQFLSPLTNRRTDQWGGSIEGRARLLMEVVRAVRAALPESAAVSVKMNSADFQRGGFDADDAIQVVEMLNRENIDLLEVSGGSYESPAMQGTTADGRTLAREAYFLEFAERIASHAEMPIMTTGGVFRKSTAQQVLDAGVSLVGIGRALAFHPDLVSRWEQGDDYLGTIPELGWKDKTLKAMAVMAITKRQFQRMGKGTSASTDLSPFYSLLQDQIRTRWLTHRYKKEVSAR